MAYPASPAAGDLLVLIAGMHPSSANSGTLTTPSGWTLVMNIGGSDFGGYGSTNGTDTGNCRIWALTKSAAGTESGSLSVTIGSSSAAWGQIHRLSAAAGSTWSVAGGSGGDSSAGNVSITCSSDPSIAGSDYILGAFSCPTNAFTAPFWGDALSATGVTFGTVTHVSDAQVSNNNHAGGFTMRAPVNSGTSSAAPVMTANAQGVATNVRGPGIVLRIREVVAVANPPRVLINQAVARAAYY